MMLKHLGNDADTSDAPGFLSLQNVGGNELEVLDAILNDVKDT